MRAVRPQKLDRYGIMDLKVAFKGMTTFVVLVNFPCWRFKAWDPMHTFFYILVKLLHCLSWDFQFDVILCKLFMRGHFKFLPQIILLLGESETKRLCNQIW